MLVLTVGQARAELFTLDASGTGIVNSGSFRTTGNLSGFLTADSSTGLFSSGADLSALFFTGFATFSTVLSQGPDQTAPRYDVRLQNANADELELTLSLAPLPLIANNGGSIEDGKITKSTGQVSAFAIAGDLSATAGGPSAIPIPDALPLFATGLGALGLLGWRRKKKLAA